MDENKVSKQRGRKAQCSRLNTCSAPICPIDKHHTEAVWYPSEPKCLKEEYRLKYKWLRRMFETKHHRNADYYFDVEMLAAIPKGVTKIKGIDDPSEKAQWLKDIKKNTPEL